MYFFNLQFFWYIELSYEVSKIISINIASYNEPFIIELADCSINPSSLGQCFDFLNMIFIFVALQIFGLMYEYKTDVHQCLCLVLTLY